MNNNEKEKLINEYINQLNKDEKIVLEIAKECLKSSFSIEKSIGYLTWIKNNNLKK